MRLSSLVDAVPAAFRIELPHADPVIRGVTYDSRAVTAGDLFCALRGAEVDGHSYLHQALELGAAAVLVEPPVEGLELGDCPALVVRDSRRALAPIARCFYGNPSNELNLVGVTGTNGKTSVTYLVESILARAQRRVGLIGTVEIRSPGERERSLNTTPESLDLQRALRNMRTRGVDAVVMEVSSHGLELQRVAGCRFSVGAFTNLSQDHLDFHAGMDAYRDAKVRLFRDHLAPGASAVVNVDDAAAPAFVAASRAAGAQLIRVSRLSDSDAEVALEHAEVRMDGTRARLRIGSDSLDVALPLLGDFNLENLLVATGIAVGLDISGDTLAEGIAACPQVPGRIERIAGETAGEPTVIVDYAHTPDAVAKLLATLRPLTDGRLITVFGCGGDRDRSKRPLMAQAAARLSDRVLATSDNPRTEAPERILSDAAVGLDKLELVAPERLDATESGYSVIVDRREAIQLAIAMARPQDTVAIAGKGHEDYQIVGRKKLPFSDPDEVRHALRLREAP
ncbi:MAG: UDP-N-acetylmuramoyl-L-alanyl-D-glutamate--2,6-diaminopimelate ligase [Deltaproteobacteria bacterium]|nr:UDP-N-acetylmuramoyl-L-alanyl-D-glutamate--2,6-diaminopimelate ligase [Deltaproteobacteria bacterium]